MIYLLVSEITVRVPGSCDTMAKACLFFVCLFCVFNKELSKTQSGNSEKIDLSDISEKHVRYK